ncbi:MAG: hypothetical protein H8E56_01940 [Candidatus Marinimicrobia bacterium]|nr:hypothetical protein [Candidatus Neomarinimicrobiota bacterium]
MGRKLSKKVVDRNQWRQYLSAAKEYCQGAINNYDNELWTSASVLFVHAAIAYTDALTIKAASVKSAQIYILHALVSKVPALFNKERKAKINVTRTLQQLIKRGIINKNNNRMYTFADPMFRIFIERKFL